MHFTSAHFRDSEKFSKQSTSILYILRNRLYINMSLYINIKNIQGRYSSFIIFTAFTILTTFHWFYIHITLYLETPYSNYGKNGTVS